MVSAILTLFFLVTVTNYGEAVSPCSHKRGIGLNPDTWSDPRNPSFFCSDMSAIGEVNWWYDWGMADIHGWGGAKYSCPGKKGPPGFVPILRKHEYSTAESLPKFDGVNAILGFNEPNFKAQDNVSPRWAAEEWKKISAKYPDKVLVSPAAAPCSGSGCNNGNAKEWFTKFFAACKEIGGCKVDYLATHIYTCDADYTMKYLKELYDAFKLKIWLTEFACPGKDTSKIKSYMTKVLPKLEAAHYVEKYAWFASRFVTQAWGSNWYLSDHNSLLKNGHSELSDLGKLYMSCNHNPQPTSCQKNRDYNSGVALNWWMIASSSSSDCDRQCSQHKECTHFTWVGPRSANKKARDSCWMKKGSTTTAAHIGATSGPKGCTNH